MGQGFQAWRAASITSGPDFVTSVRVSRCGLCLQARAKMAGRLSSRAPAKDGCAQSFLSASGVAPVIDFTAAPIWLWLEKPQRWAISASGSCVKRTSSIARSVRLLMTHLCGESPVVALKHREKCQGLIQATAASSAIERSTPRFASVKSITLSTRRSAPPVEISRMVEASRRLRPMIASPRPSA